MLKDLVLALCLFVYLRIESGAKSAFNLKILYNCSLKLTCELRPFISSNIVKCFIVLLNKICNGYVLIIKGSLAS